MFVSKHSRKWDEAIYRKYLREGRGQGVGIEYTPWILIQDFPSKGMVSRVQGTKTGRIHHLMSNLETSFFFILDWSDDVLDIREQYPLLDLRQIIEISEAAQIKYPYDPKSGFPYVMTSDFYVETIRGPVVIAVKTSSDLENPRVREKLEIERRYWSNKNVRWKIVSENEINWAKARNIEWLSQARDLQCFALSEEMQTACIDYFLMYYESQSPLISDLLSDMELRFGLSTGIGVNIYKYLAYWKRIDFDASKQMNFTSFTGRPVCLIA
jgi:hypothetical protein